MWSIAATGGAVRASDHIREGGRLRGAACMRSLLALGLLINLSAPASAAKRHHQPHLRPHAIVRPSQQEVVPPGWYKFPGYPPIPPEQNRNLDASNRSSA
jgi:hypothetical protein